MADRKAAKYSPEAEAEIRGWIASLTGEDVPEGQYEVEKKLRDGTVLCNLLAKLYEGTPSDSLPAGCNNVNTKPSDSDQSFKQMENIENFLRGCKAYGVPENGLFASADLYEGRNMPMVLSTILQLGSEAQRHKFNGPKCGPGPKGTRKGKKKFTKAQLRGGQSILTLQTGTNKFASQKGMRIGSQRHVTDIKTEDMDQAGASELTLQGGTNKFASQKGMRIGAVRHICDIRADDASAEGQGIINLQAGSNQFASQKGMRGGFGAVRHISDIRADDYHADSAGVLSLQCGTNEFASQKGMTSMGAVRHVADIRSDDMSAEGSAVLNLQSGWNKGASQSGMTSFGACRHVADIKVKELYDESDEDDEDEDDEEQCYE